MSRTDLPKQLMPFIEGKRLLKLAFERLEGLVEPQRRIVCAGKVEDKVESFIYVPGGSGTGLRFDGYTTGVIRKHIPQSLLFYPLGLPDVTN
jgi:hypothetical protein